MLAGASAEVAVLLFFRGKGLGCGLWLVHYVYLSAYLSGVNECDEADEVFRRQSCIYNTCISIEGPLLKTKQK